MPLGCVILEGGGNAELRAWKAFGEWVNTIRKASPKSAIPARALYAARKIVTFIQGGDTFSKKVMEDLSSAERKSFVDESSSIVPSLLKRECVGANCQMLSERVRGLSERALQKGLDCSRRAKHKWLSQALKGGAGPAHRWCGKEDALPEPPLVVRDSQGNFTADPQCEAELYAHEWKREWGGEDAISIVKENNQFSCSTGKHVAEAREWASKLDLQAGNVRKACLSFPSKKAIGLDQHAFTDIALFPDNALESLGEIIRQYFVKLAIPTQPLLQLLVFLGKKMEGAELSPSCTQHIASPCAWYQHTTVDGMSSLQVSGILRLKVTQRSEHMLQGRWASSWPTLRVNAWSIFSGTCGNSTTASRHIF